MQDRVQKLLLLAGDQGALNQSRDFKKIVQTIVGQYLSKNEAGASNKIIQIFTNLIDKIPLKQHIYAGLTAKISQKMKQQSNQIILISLSYLERALSNFQFYESLNLLTYFSELMNISLLNSLSFMNILEDISDKLESQNNPQIKKFYSSILVRTIPICMSSLSQKLFQDLKKFIDMLEVHTQNDALFSYMKKLLNKGQIINYSLMERLGDNFQGVQQFTIKRKLKIEQNLQRFSQWNPVEYLTLYRSNQDQLYRQFAQQQGRIHLFIVEQLIQTFYKRNNILTLKIQNYIYSIPSHKQAYLYQLIISGLISKCLKSLHPIVQQSLLLGIINNFDAQNNKIEQQSNKLTKNDLCKMLSNQIFDIFKKGQTLDYNNIILVANLISFLINNWKQEWEWERFSENQEGFIKRKVLLLLILEKVKFLNDNFEVPEVLAKLHQDYQTTDKLTNQHQYQTAEDLQIFQNFQNALKSKSSSSIINEMIKNQQSYQIFLQALFRLTSLTQTHLKTLIQRYKQVLLCNQQFDWTLINKIRNFWKKSFLNRQMYLNLMIKQEFVAYSSYVNYIGQLKDKNQNQMIWIRVELNQLNNIFGNNMNKKKSQ